MSRGRKINLIFWLWYWLSDFMRPLLVGPDQNYWFEKLNHAFMINRNIDDPWRFIGNGVIPLVMWFIIDQVLWWRDRRRKAARAAAAATPPSTPA